MSFTLPLSRRLVFQVPATLRPALVQSRSFAPQPQIRFFTRPTQCLLAKAVKPHSQPAGIQQQLQRTPSRYTAPPPRPPPSEEKKAAYLESSLVSRLSSWKGPNDIFLANSYGSFATASYLASVFLISAAAWYFTGYYLYPPEEAPKWAPVLYGFCSFGMLGMGLWIMGSPLRCIKSIHAVPTKGQLQLRIKVYKSLVQPLGKSFVVPVSSVTLREPIDWLEARRNVVIRQQEQQAKKDALEEQEPWIIRKLLGSVRIFRKAGRAMLRDARKYFLRSEFVMLHVEGKGSYKLDWHCSHMMYNNQGYLLRQLIKVQY